MLNVKWGDMLLDKLWLLAFSYWQKANSQKLMANSKKNVPLRHVNEDSK